MSVRCSLLNLTTVILVLCQLVCNSAAQPPKLSLQPNDHVCFIGNTLADRMQHHGWLETYLQADTSRSQPGFS